LTKTAEMEKYKDLKKLFEACRKENPFYYEWIKKQLNRYGKKGSAKYDIQERALALSLYYTCGEKGYK